MNDAIKNISFDIIFVGLYFAILIVSDVEFNLNLKCQARHILGPILK